MSSELITSFFINGDSLDPAACTAALGIDPTRTRRKEDPRYGLKPPRARNEWMLGTGWLELDNLNDSLDRLLDVLWPAHRVIVAFCSESGATTSVLTGVRILQLRPDYSVSRENVSRLADLRASYSLDIYDYREGQSIVQ